MAGITALIAIIALLSAIAALWMVTEAIKKIDSRTRRIIDSQMRGLKSSFAQLAEQLQKSHKTQEALVNRVRDVVKNREATSLEIKELKNEIGSLKGQLAENSAGVRRKA